MYFVDELADYCVISEDTVCNKCDGKILSSEKNSVSFYYILHKYFGKKIKNKFTKVKNILDSLPLKKKVLSKSYRNC